MAEGIRPAGTGNNLRSPQRQTAKWVISGLFIVVFAIFGGVVWMALNEVRSLNREPLVVRAPSGPIKRVPEDRGGLAVLNESSPLVRSLEQPIDQPGPERILPPEETPPQSALQALNQAEDGGMAANAALLNEREGLALQPAGGPILATDSEVIPPVEALRSNEPGIPEIEIAGLVKEEPPVVEARAEPAIIPLPVEPETAEQVAVAGPVGDFRLQLLASRNPDAVQAAWARLQDQYDPLFDNVGAHVVDIDTDNGRFYRLQVGPYAGRDAAATACEQVKSQGGDCFVVGPIS